MKIYLSKGDWENGEKIFEGTQSGTRIDDSSTDVEIKWSILKNKYHLKTLLLRGVFFTLYDYY